MHSPEWDHSDTHTWAWAGRSAPPWSIWPTPSCPCWWSTGSDRMVSHNPQWLEHSNSGRAQYQGSVGKRGEKEKEGGGEVKTGWHEESTPKSVGFLRIRQRGVVVTHSYCGSAVRAFMWNVPAGWWEVKCCWTRNTAWYTHTKQSPRTIQKQSQGAEQIWDQKSEIISLIMWLSVSLYLQMCVHGRVYWRAFAHLCVCLYVHMWANYNVCSCNTLMAFCQVLPHGELMPSINSACIYQVKTQQFAACKLLLGYLCKFSKLTAYE